MTLSRLLAAAAVLALPCSAASATIIQADYTESLDLPGDGSAGPRLEQLTGVTLPAPSPQLTAADIVSNPSGWAIRSM